MKRLLSPWWALLTLGLLAYMFLQNPAFVESIKLRYFDQLITNQESVQTDIVVAEINETTLEQYGQYPFPRDTYAEIIDNLYQIGARLVVFNVMMPEADRFGGDDKLAETLAKYPVVVPLRPDFKVVNPPLAPKVNVVGVENAGILQAYPGLINNIPQVEDNAAGSGIVGVEEEVDGVVRRIPNIAIVQPFEGFVFPSLALETLRVSAGAKSTDVKIEPYGVTMFRVLKDFRTREFYYIPVDSEGRTWIDWSQKATHVTIGDLPNDVVDKIVIVDVTAAGIANPVATATGGEFPGTVQAAMLGTMINGTNIQRPAELALYERIGLLAGGLLLILLSRWMLVGLGATVLMIGSVVPASMYLFETQKLLVDVTAPVITLVLIALQVYGIKFVREFLEKQAIKKQFAGYCSPEVVRLLQEDPDIIKKGIEKEVSVMFSDLRGFTPIGGYYGDKGHPERGGVEGLQKYMNGYMDAITQPILDHNGMVIKYVGDASMHIQGAPIEDLNHAYNIVETGLQMLDAVDAYCEKVVGEGKPPAAMGFGVNTGLGFIGETGSSARHNYDILGDMVSVAARLEARCKAYGVLCIIGNETYKRTQDDFFYLYLDNLQPKGVSVSDYIWTALRVKCTNALTYDDARDKHNEMHELYKAKKFDKAIEMCKELVGSFDGQMDKYYAIWIERCEFMKTMKLPKDWSGAWVATEK